MRFKNYEDFLNEGFFDKVKSLVKMVGSWFKGVGSFFLNGLLLQSNKKLPKGVTFYPAPIDIEILKDNGVNIDYPRLPVREGRTYERIEEAVIQTKYPDAGKIRDVNAAELDAFIRDTVEGGKDIKPLLVWGAPGIGKTAILNAIAKEYFGPDAKEKRRLIDFDLMTMSGEDFFMPSVTGRDTPDAKGARLPDEWLPVYRIDDPDGDKRVNGPDGLGGILFFDEIARCKVSVQNVCLKIIDERRVGSYVLGSKWVIICAANRKSDLSDDEQESFKWSSTLANRFQQVNFAAEIEDWAPWALSAKDDLGRMLVKPEIVAFLKFNQKYFHLLDPEDFSNSSGGSEAWPSPRSWTNASQAILAREARYEKNGWKDKFGKKIGGEQWMQEQQAILTANVGPDAASAFVGFQRLMKEIRPEDIELVWTNGAKAPKWKGMKIDQTYALISAACFQVRGKETLTKAQMDNFTTWCVNSGDAPNSIKAMNLLYEVVPSVAKDNYWIDNCKNRFVDAYPSIFTKSKD